MDIYKILETLNNLENGSDDHEENWGITNPELLAELITAAEEMSSEEFYDEYSRFLDDPIDFWSYHHEVKGHEDEFAEDSMASAAKHPTFNPNGGSGGDYATGSMSAAQAKKHLVGGCEESVELSLEEELMAEWNTFQESLGGPAGGATTGTSNAEVTKLAKGLNTLKQAGVPLPGSTTTTAANVDKALDDPKANVIKGQGLDNQTKGGVAAVGGGVLDAMKNMNPGQQTAMAALLKQANKQQPGTTTGPKP
jgi:hypothetical protein